MRSWERLVACFSLCVLGGEVASCQTKSLVFEEPYPYSEYLFLDMPRMIDAADVVCKGKIIRLETKKTEKLPIGKDQEMLVEHHTMALTLEVHAVFKGDSRMRQISIEYVEALGVDEAFLPLNLRKGMYGLVFAKESEDGHKLAQRVLLPVTSSKVFHTSRNSPLEKLRKEYLVSLGDKKREVALTALALVGSLGARDAAKRLKRLAKSTDKEIKGWALTSLITTGDYSMLKDAIMQFDTETDDAVERVINGLGCIVISCVGTRWGKADEAVIRELQRWPTFRNRRLREAAREALQQIKKEGEFRGHRPQ